MIPRARLDLSWSDFAFAGLSCLLPARRDELDRSIRAVFPDGDEALLCLAARSGFDLLLSALDLPRGSEVLLSAITIPDIVRIARGHGLVPVPVDVVPETLAPEPAALERALSPRSRVLVAAHLFGAVSDLGPSRAFARKHDLVFVEDCAQSYVPGRFHGHPESDVRMISFGPIKTDTALGGGMLFVRDGALRARMEELRGALPLQTRRAYARRVLRYAGLQMAALRVPFALFRAACRVAGRDFDSVLRQAVRGFGEGDVLPRLRRRPATPLLALLARRVRQVNGRVQARTEAGETLARALPAGLSRPGAAVAQHSHWVFPVLAEGPLALMRHLAEWGFDATPGTSSLAAVPVAPERPDVRAPRAEEVMARILFVPLYPEVPPRMRLRLAQALADWATTSSGAVATSSRA
ncbi:MAG: DegT/DnrJ/EryC1/StrS family aminotransferase [Longimicrobiales bacterium]|nr:DegT/DnrJ/EryC1/StrS family aminotransferase [Longimicrobiales bacterium]